MKKTSRFLGAVCVSLATVPVSDIAFGAIVQDQVGATVSNGGLSYAVQSFTPAQDNIAGVDVYISGTSALETDVTASIWDASAWNGFAFAGTPLVTETLTNVPRSTIAELRWSAVPITPEQTYYIEFSNTALVFGVLISSTNPYARGAEQTFDTQDFIDVQFSTYYDDASVSSVPLPPAAWLFGSGLLGLIGVRAPKKAA